MSRALNFIIYISVISIFAYLHEMDLFLVQRKLNIYYINNNSLSPQKLQWLQTSKTPTTAHITMPTILTIPMPKTTPARRINHTRQTMVPTRSSRIMTTTQQLLTWTWRSLPNPTRPIHWSTYRMDWQGKLAKHSSWKCT